MVIKGWRSEGVGSGWWSVWGNAGLDGNGDRGPYDGNGLVLDGTPKELGGGVTQREGGHRFGWQWIPLKKTGINGLANAEPCGSE